MDMKPRISVLTLGVADLEQSLAFYRDGLGLPTEGIVGREFDHGAVAFFELSGGLKLAIWAQDDIAYDTGLPNIRYLRPPSLSGRMFCTEQKSTTRLRRRSKRVLRLSSRLRTRFMAATLGTSAIRTVICGR
jgi:catechol 2,3-dioxygenase-like lactoylglutathione lyase family enzyme